MEELQVSPGAASNIILNTREEIPLHIQLPGSGFMGSKMNGVVTAG